MTSWGGGRAAGPGHRRRARRRGAVRREKGVDVFAAQGQGSQDDKLGSRDQTPSLLRLDTLSCGFDSWSHQLLLTVLLIASSSPTATAILLLKVNYSNRIFS